MNKELSVLVAFLGLMSVTTQASAHDEVKTSSWGSIKALYRNDSTTTSVRATVDQLRVIPEQSMASVLAEVSDQAGHERFAVTVKSLNAELLKVVKPEQFTVTVEYEDGSSLGKLPKDERVIAPREPPGSPPSADDHTVFIEVKYLGSSTEHLKIKSVTVVPRTMRPDLGTSPKAVDFFGGTPCASICYVYTYTLYQVKSVVVRAGSCGGGTAYFYHRHCNDPCSTHWLLTSSFQSCTYAYDCYPGHSINWVWVCGYVPVYWGSPWSVTFYVYNCNGRC